MRREVLETVWRRAIRAALSSLLTCSRGTRDASRRGVRRRQTGLQPRRGRRPCAACSESGALPLFPAFRISSTSEPPPQRHTHGSDPLAVPSPCLLDHVFKNASQPDVRTIETQAKTQSGASLLGHGRHLAQLAEQGLRTDSGQDPGAPSADAPSLCAVK